MDVYLDPVGGLDVLADVPNNVVRGAATSRGLQDGDERLAVSKDRDLFYRVTVGVFFDNLRVENAFIFAML